MTSRERKLIESGYEFHGAYSWSKTEIMTRAQELRKQGHKATIVWTPGSKLSRSGSGGGWSIFWIECEASKKERARKSIERKMRELKDEENRIELRKTEIQNQLLALQNEFNAI